MRRRQRGSIVIYVAMCLLVLGMLFGAVVPLATGLRARATRRSDELRARLAFEAGVAMVRSKSLAMTLVVGTPLVVNVNGVSGTVTPAANDTQLAKSLRVTGTMVRNGQSYRFSRVIGARQPAPFQFALFTKANLVLKKMMLGSAGLNGDAFSIGNISSSGGSSVINGNLMAKGSISVGFVSVTGLSLPNQSAITWPSLTDSDYRNEAFSMNLLGIGSYNLLDASENGIAFSSPSNGKYAIRFYEGDLSLKGTISGSGTIYVKGDLTINGNLRYANASSSVAIIVKGSTTIDSSTDTLEGYLYCNGTVSIAKELSILRGAIVADTLDSNKDLSIIRDNAIRDDTDQAVRLRLPYYWP